MPDDRLRIMIVTPKVVQQNLGGAEYHAWGLARSLAGRGHRVEIFTTCSSHYTPAHPGYLLWNNSFPAGRSEREGVVLHRFPTRNARPFTARVARRRMDRRLAEEEREEGFVRGLSGLLEPGDACLASGWHSLEEWEDGPARWTSREAWMVLSDEGISAIRLRVHSPLAQELYLDDGEGWRRGFAFQAGETRDMEVEPPARGSLVLRLTAQRVYRPEIDRRELGVALRGLEYLRGEEEIRIGLDSGLESFLETGPEDSVFALLAGTAGGRPGRYQRYQEKVIGPNSPGLARAVRDEARRFDAVIATHLPHTTMAEACEAARQAGTPCIALPLLHPRDRYAYWPRYLECLRGVDRIDGNSPTLARILAGLGPPAFSPGPGLYLREFQETADPGGFREKYGIGAAPVLLWVGRKNPRKGYADAAEVVRLLRERGEEALLVMVGLDEDGIPVSGKEALYLGPLDRRELLDAYACCSMMILPSRDESFGITLCEAWMAGKPVLAWERCSASRDLVVNGENGYLCASVEELADAAGMLLRDPGLAGRLGEKGREMVLENFLWESIAEQYEAEIVKIRESRKGASAGAGGGRLA